MEAHTEPLPRETLENVRMEYNALRTEILKRLDLRAQFVSIALTISGVFLGFGIANSAVALVYPPLAVFLAIGWAQNDIRIGDLAIYVRENIEKKLPGLGWETCRQQERVATKNRMWRFTMIAHGGIFVLTQLLAMLIGILRFAFTPLEWTLLALDAAAVVFVVLELERTRRR